MLAGCGGVPGELEQVGAYGGQAMVLGEGAVPESVEHAQAGRGAVGHRDGDGPVEVTTGFGAMWSRTVKSFAICGQSVLSVSGDAGRAVSSGSQAGQALGQLGPAVHAGLGEDRLEMVGDREGGQEELGTDLGGGATGQRQAGDLPLPPG